MNTSSVDYFEECLTHLNEARTGEDFKLWLFETGYWVHTQEQLERFEKAVNEVQTLVLQADPYFKEEYDSRRQAMQQQVESERARVRTQADQIVQDSEAKARQMEGDNIDKFLAEHKFKVRPPKDLAEQPKLVCPICGDPDYGNSVNGVPFCLKCNHKLVSPSELKNYNREYKRKFRQMKKNESNNKKRRI